MSGEADGRVDDSTGLPVSPRGRPITFTFDGRNVRGFQSDSVASAIYASGERVLMRSIKYHRPRGYFCGVGKCGSCLVRVDGIPNARACVTPAKPGLRVESQNAWPSARFDVLSIVDLVFRRKFDYHARFIRPGFLKPVYHAVIRRMAGFGDIPDERAMPPRRPRIRALEPDIVIVGAGAAGLAALRAAAREGASVLLVDESPRPGGTLRYETGALGDAADGAAGPEYAAAALAEACAGANVEVLAQATAVGLYRPQPAAEPVDDARATEDDVGTLVVMTADGLVEVRPRALVVATGALEVPPLFPGNDLPGIMGARAAQRLLIEHGVLPGEDVAVAGRAPLAALVADQLRRAGARVVAEADASGIIAAHGGRRVTSVTLATEERVACDALVYAAGAMARIELLQQADCRLAYDADGLQFAVVDGSGATTTPRVFAAGACAGSMDAAESVRQGERAGREAALATLRARREASAATEATAR